MRQRNTPFVEEWVLYLSNQRGGVFILVQIPIFQPNISVRRRS